MSPREYAAASENHASAVPGAGDAFFGCGVIGLPFKSGHVLALRRFSFSSIGPGYTSVWHREPGGRWTIYSTVPPELSCARYFGGAVERNVVTGIEVDWTGPADLRVVLGDTLGWNIRLRSSMASILWHNAPLSLRARALRSPGLLGLTGRAAGMLLGIGRVNLTGLTPNAHRFVARPGPIWLIDDSSAVVEGVELGETGPLREQASLGDWRLPQRGLFAVAGVDMLPPRRRLPAGASRQGTCRLTDDPRTQTT